MTKMRMRKDTVVLNAYGGSTSCRMAIRNMNDDVDMQLNAHIESFEKYTMYISKVSVRQSAITGYWKARCDIVVNYL